MITTAVGNAMMSALQFMNAGQQKSGDVVLNVDGVTLARIINPYLAREGARIGGTMITAK
jgi:hypothetical protein